MPIVLDLDARDWAGSRFVRSRLWEVSQAVGLLNQPRRQLYHRAWLQTIDTRAALARTPVLSALSPSRGWVPDFLVPPPTAHR